MQVTGSSSGNEYNRKKGSSLLGTEMNAAAPAQGMSRGDRVVMAYRRIRELIVLGRLAPGTRIIETTIAARLGVSRTPIRAALQRLQQEGYVVAAGPGQQSRMSVAALTREDAIELFTVLSAVEGLAASLAAVRPDDERRAAAAELRGLNKSLLDASRTPRRDVARAFELDYQFHRLIVEAGAGPRLLALHDSFKPQSERYGRIYSSALIDEISASVGEHENIVRCIEAGDGRAAERAMRLNWQNASDRLARVIGAVGERGAW
jgi:DNA-binding GntR family transcriptional regulator